METNPFKIFTRPERQKLDRFGTFRYFLKASMNTMQNQFLVIDETLYPYWGKIVIFQYNPNKPAIYGIL